MPKKPKRAQFNELPLPHQDAIMLKMRGCTHAEILSELRKRYPKTSKWTLATVEAWFRSDGDLREIYDKVEKQIAERRLEKMIERFAEKDENILTITTNAMRAYGQKINEMAKELSKENPDYKKLQISVNDFKTAFEVQRTILNKSLGRYELGGDGLGLLGVIEKLNNKEEN